MKPTTLDTLEDRIGELPDVIVEIKALNESLVEALGCAETVEKPADFDANINEAIGYAERILKALKEICS